MDVQYLDNPSEEDRILQLIQGDDIWTTVWLFADLDCELYTTMQPFAAGPVDYLTTDIDLLEDVAFGIPNMNAFNLTATASSPRLMAEDRRNLILSLTAFKMASNGVNAKIKSISTKDKGTVQSIFSDSPFC